MKNNFIILDKFPKKWKKSLFKSLKTYSKENLEELKNILLSKEAKIFELDFKDLNTFFLKKRLKEHKIKIEDIKTTLFEKQKAELLAHSIAGFCHEIRNLMTPFILLEFIQNNVNQKDKKHIEKIIESKNQILNLTQEINDLYKTNRNIEKIFLTPLIKIIKKSIHLATLSRKFGNKIKIKVSKKISERNKIYILLKHDKLIQIFMNLIQNAIDAIKDTKEPKIYVFIKQIKKNLVISIVDNGPGISQENIQNIWKPKFTTKEKLGTGLGLYIVKNILRKYSSKIFCKSILNEKTQFKISIPLKIL